jgi:hypothetical protein
MSTARQRALNAIKVGDVVYGVSDSGQEKLLIVYGASKHSFLARHITSQTSAEFGRDGKSRPIPAGGTCTIVSTAALPPQDYEVALGLDRKMRTARELTDYRLSGAEKRLILTYGDYFKAWPLPED